MMHGIFVLLYGIFVFLLWWAFTSGANLHGVAYAVLASLTVIIHIAYAGNNHDQAN